MVGAWRGIEPRLVRLDLGGRENLDAYRRIGGYRRSRRGQELIEALQALGVRGRGGAGFPAARKWIALRERPGPRVVIANGAEGEPRSWKDRYLMRYRPHLVLNGLFCAAEAVEADRAIVYSADSSSLESVRGAIAELEAPPLPVEFFRADDTYVAGEETAAVRAINEGIAKPTAKPPRPFERGVDSRPTLVHNVETLAVVALLATGTDNGAMTRAATFLATIHGACSRPGLYELPYGITLADALEHAAGGASGNVPGFLMGGYFAGFLNRRGLGLRLSFDDLREAGSGLGCAAITVLGETDCPVAVAATVMRFFARESAGQCGPCVKGTAALSETLDSFTAGQGTHADLERVEQWSTTLRGRGACALLDGATLLVRSLLREFSETVRDHIHGSCPLCRRSSAPLL